MVVLAFFAQRIIAPNNEEKVPTYPQFVEQVESGQVKTVVINTEDTTIDVERQQPGPGQKYTTGYLDNTEPALQKILDSEKVPYDVKGKGGGGWLSVLTYVLPFVIFLLFWLFIMNQMQGGGSKVMSFGKSRAKRMSVDSPKITLPRRGRGGGGRRGAPRDQGVPREPEEVPGPRRAHPQGRPALRPSGHRQDPARPGGGR
ncbi:MAG: ATP-dependent metallopeptidase FtsH/Yme1/Tma family protein [Thermoleophilaceae bacterium]